jgi:glutamyl-tRNA(Gln) amidotransferase subunit E
MAFNYKELGFKCGLEIHQRLDTSTKLFCRCGTSIETEEPILNIERYQRAVAGETGHVDRSTSFESGRKREFRYRVFRKTTCLVDMDEEPPHGASQDALETALRIAAYLDTNVPDEIEPMRKEVVDGSNPSSFQRSMMIGYGGKLSFGKISIEIPSIFLEEESSGIEDTKGELAVYRTDRLGIPLIEIDTAPTIANPKEAKEIAMQIGLLLRLSGKVQRGIGSIRQDVNVSIKKGTRVEVKGLQELDRMDAIIEKEVERQVNLVEIAEELKRRGASVGKAENITKIFANTKSQIISNGIKHNGVVIGAKLSKFKGLIGKEINEGKRLGTEISDYAKKGGVKGIIHSDESMEKYSISEKEIKELEKELKLSDSDSFILIAAEKQTAEKAMDYALMRAELSLQGVPPETRAAEPNADTTRFMRPLPGGSRMYPETDILPINPDKDAYARMVKNKLSPEEIRKDLEKDIGNKQLAEQMLWSYNYQLYTYLRENTKVQPSIIASTLLEKFTELRRKGVSVDEISNEALKAIFENYSEERITKLGIEELLKTVPKSKAEVSRYIKEKNLERISGHAVEKLVKDNKGANADETRNRIMAKYRINVDGSELNSAIKKIFGG